MTQKGWNDLLAYVLVLENISHYLLHCYHNTLFRIDFTKSSKIFIVDFESLSGNKKAQILLCEDSRYDDNKKNSVFSAFINYIRKTKRFDCSLFVKTTFSNHFLIYF